MSLEILFMLEMLLLRILFIKRYENDAFLAYCRSLFLIFTTFRERLLRFTNTYECLAIALRSLMIIDEFAAVKPFAKIRSGVNVI